MRSPILARAVCLVSLVSVGLAMSLLSPALPVAHAAPEKAADGIRFTYTDPNAGAIAWAGAFNNWSMTANPLVRGADGVWSVVIPLPAGDHPYKFVVDGQWFADPENGVTAGAEGNSIVRVGAGGEVVRQAATSNTPYSPKINIGGRTISLFHETWSPRFGRWELTRPMFDIDVGMDVRVSDVLRAHLLMNIDPEREDVRDDRSRLNFKRGSLEMTQRDLRITAFDSENIGTWDDPARLVGGIGVFDHPYGYQRQGVTLSVQKLGFDSQFLLSDNFDDRNNTNSDAYRGFSIDNFPTFTIPAVEPQSRTSSYNPTFAFVDDWLSAYTALAGLTTERAGSGYRLIQDQTTKISSLDFGDNGKRFGFGDNYRNTYAARVRRHLPGGLTLGALGRSDRGYGFGRLTLAEPLSDSTARLLSLVDSQGRLFSGAMYSQQWFGGGLDASLDWSPTIRLYGEVLLGARRLNFVNGSVSSILEADSLLSTRAVFRNVASETRNIDGDHLTVDRGGRFIVGGSWTFAKGDVTLRGSIEHQTHRYPAWTQAPVAPAGQPPVNHRRFETVDYQLGSYLGSDRDIENSMTATRLAWDRNWRYYLDREVKTTLEVEWVGFDYDQRTAWEHQLWFPTGNFWLESGQHLVSIDRLTVLGEEHTVRVRPRLEVPLLRSRDMRFVYQGTLAGIDLGHRPRYAESVLQFGFDLSRTLRFNSDTRWVKYDAPLLALDRGFISQYSEVVLKFSPTIELSLGRGVDPEVLDPNTNEYGPIGRDVFLNDRNANGYYAETNYLSLAPQIRGAEQALQDLRRFQLQAIVRF